MRFSDLSTQLQCGDRLFPESRVTFAQSIRLALLPRANGGSRIEARPQARNEQPSAVRRNRFQDDVGTDFE